MAKTIIKRHIEGECFHCKRTYTLDVDPNDESIAYDECPYCEGKNTRWYEASRALEIEDELSVKFAAIDVCSSSVGDDFADLDNVALTLSDTLEQIKKLVEELAAIAKSAPSEQLEAKLVSSKC